MAPQIERLKSVPGPLTTEQLAAVAADSQQKGLVKLPSIGDICSCNSSTPLGTISSWHRSASTALLSQEQMPLLADDLEAQLADAFLLQLQLQPDVASHVSSSSGGVQHGGGSSDGGGRTATTEDLFGDKVQQHTWSHFYHQPPSSSWPPSMPLLHHAPQLSYSVTPQHQEPEFMLQHGQNLYQQNQLAAVVHQQQEHLQSLQAVELSIMQLRQEQQQLQQIQLQYEQDFAVMLQNLGLQAQLQAQQKQPQAPQMDQLVQVEIAKVLQQCSSWPPAQSGKLLFYPGS